MAAALTGMLKTAVARVPVASCACAVKIEIPTVVGVPEMMPVVGDRERPAGSAPETMLQV